jgi:hypothetical protein
VLRCVECNAATTTTPEVELHQAKGHRLGWMTFSVQDPDLESERFVVTYCTECLAREFGGVLRWLPTARSA